jgi:hypothetical protein
MQLCSRGKQWKPPLNFVNADMKRMIAMALNIFAFARSYAILASNVGTFAEICNCKWQLVWAVAGTNAWHDFWNQKPSLINSYLSLSIVQNKFVIGWK